MTDHHRTLLAERDMYDLWIPCFEAEATPDGRRRAAQMREHRAICQGAIDVYERRR